jgi:hypothetical protein
MIEQVKKIKILKLLLFNSVLIFAISSFIIAKIWISYPRTGADIQGKLEA